MGTVRAGSAKGLLEFVAARGASPERVLAAAGLLRSDLTDPDHRMPIEHLVRLMNAAARELGDDAFGIHFGEARDFLAIGVLAYAVLHAPTIGAALRNFDRYNRIHVQHGTLRFATEGERASLGFDFGVLDYEFCRHYVESAAVFGHRMLQTLCGGEWHPQLVRFGHRRPKDTREHERVFGAPLAFEQPVHMEVVFAASELEREVVGADRALLRVVEQHLDAHLAADPRGAWVDDVRRAVAAALTSGTPTVHAVSRRLGTSARTLQRRLEGHGVAFQRLVAEVRMDFADQYLSKPELSLSEVAFLLGYSDLSSFHRAYRRWSGTTPLEKRRMLHGSGPS